MPKRLYYRFERWNGRWGAALALFMLAVIAVSISGTTFVYLTRGQAVRSFLDCSDQRDAYAAEQSQTLRDATDAHDLAAQRADVADLRWSVLLDRAFQAGTKATKAEIAAFAHATHVREETRARAVAASRDLRRVRAATPVVPAASELCRDGVFQRPTDLPTTPAATPSVPPTRGGETSPKALSGTSVSPSAQPTPHLSPVVTPTPSPRPTATVTVTTSPTPTPDPSPTGGLVELVDNTLRHLGLPPLPLPTP